MTALPEDDRTREPAIARPEDPALLHLAVVGDTYTVLLSGEQTAGRFAMLDMLIPPGGPPPHRHNFEECFRVIDGSLEVWVRDLPPVRLEAGDTANIPANAPHAFRNPAQVPARLLCTAAPAGLEKFFAEFGDPVPRRARRSATPSAKTGYAAPWRRRLGTAWRSCPRPPHEHSCRCPTAAHHRRAGRGRAQVITHRREQIGHGLGVLARQRLGEQLVQDLDVIGEHLRQQRRSCRGS